MARRDDDLDRITTLLGQCLGRIDEQAYRLQSDDGDNDFEASDTLERETAILQDLVGSALRAARPEHGDLDRVVDRSLRGLVAELGIPIVVRQNLAGELPPVRCAPGELACAVQRALVLALSGIEVGGEISVTTRMDGEAVLFEIESRQVDEPRLDDRAATLSEFVETLGGRCQIDSDGRSCCLIAMELRPALVTDG